MLPGISFEVQQNPPPTDRNRMDVACFVGFARVRGERLRTLPGFLVRHLRAQGLLDGPYALPEARLQQLLNVPIPIESYSAYATLFETEARADDAPPYLATCVRSFFAQGGSRCYIVRAGDPIPSDARPNQRRSRIRALIPQVSDGALHPADPGRWQGIGLLHATPEAAFLSLPDLPYLLHRARDGGEVVEHPVPERSHFVQCAQDQRAPEVDRVVYRAPAPRLISRNDYLAWRDCVRQVIDFLSSHRKDVQLVASLPLPLQGVRWGVELFASLLAWRLLDATTSATGCGSAHLQLAYPWLRWVGSRELPEGLEPPEGALVGVLARNTLRNGTYRSATGQPLYHVSSLEPVLSQEQRERPETLPPQVQRSLRQRVSLLGETQRGFEVLSDVTLSVNEAYRHASVNRLMSVWVRALSQAGDRLVFESSGPRLWRAVREFLSSIGEFLIEAGALRQGPGPAYSVRCDRSTMTQSDLDEGRVVAEVLFQPTLPIDAIRVSLSLDEQRRVSVLAEAS